MPPDYLYELAPAAMFLTTLGATALVALTIDLLLRLPFMRRFCGKISDFSPVMMTMCGTLFVLSVTFLANSIWQAEDRARESVNTEARNLRVMHTYLNAMTGPSREGFAQIIKSYGDAVAGEWPVMRDMTSRAPAEQQLQEIYAAAIRGFSEGEQNRLLQQRILAALDQLSSARQQRLAMAQDLVSGGQWFLVSALGLLLLLVVALGHGRFPLARAVALSAISLAISIALFVIISHDRPFIGYSAVGPQPILTAAGVVD